MHADSKESRQLLTGASYNYIYRKIKCDLFQNVNVYITETLSDINFLLLLQCVFLLCHDPLEYWEFSKEG